MEISMQLQMTSMQKTCSTVLRQQKIFTYKAVNCEMPTKQEKKKLTNFYEVLSLGSENVDFDEIKKAYRNMALKYHPDVCPPSKKEESNRRFLELRKAYETLSDPVSRMRYDYELGLLVDSSSFRGFYMGEDDDEIRRSMFSKEVWEKQLLGLKKRSHDRMQRKKTNVYM